MYSRVPFDANINAVLERAHGRLIASPIHARHVKPNVFLTNSTRLYASLSLYVGGNSFGKGFAMLPTTNIYINATGYQYFKYYMLVKYLLEQEKISVDELFTREFDADALANKVLKWLSLPAQSVRLFDDDVDCQLDPRNLVPLRICAEGRGELRRGRWFE